MKRITYSLLLAAICLACGPDKKAQQQTRFEEVMSIHDEVMPKMGDIRKLRKKMETQADSLLSIDSIAAQKYTAMALELDAASESMMNWMRSFTDPDESVPHEEVMKYYDEQLDAIMGVRDEMINAVEKAENIQ